MLLLCPKHYCTFGEAPCDCAQAALPKEYFRLARNDGTRVHRNEYPKPIVNALGEAGAALESAVRYLIGAGLHPDDILEEITCCVGIFVELLRAELEDRRRAEGNERKK